MSQVTYNTVPEWQHKASAFMVFPDVHSACAGASVLRDETTVDAVELFDRCVSVYLFSEQCMLLLRPCGTISHMWSIAAGTVWQQA